MLSFFFFNDTATTEIYTLSLHDALPIWDAGVHVADVSRRLGVEPTVRHGGDGVDGGEDGAAAVLRADAGVRGRRAGVRGGRQSPRPEPRHGNGFFAAHFFETKTEDDPGC